LTCIAFDGEAELLEAAIRSATANVRAAGFDVARIEMEALDRKLGALGDQQVPIPKGPLPRPPKGGRGR
jgi:hypothetical protein